METNRDITNTITRVDETLEYNIHNICMLFVVDCKIHNISFCYRKIAYECYFLSRAKPVK